MIAGDHPFLFSGARVRAQRSGISSQPACLHTPDSLCDERETLQRRGTDITVNWLEGQLSALKRHQELGIHSKILLDGRTAYIPMLDFAIDQIGPGELGRIRAFLPEHVFLTSDLFSSGRTYHGYATSLLGQSSDMSSWDGLC